MSSNKWLYWFVVWTTYVALTIILPIISEKWVQSDPVHNDPINSFTILAIIGCLVFIVMIIDILKTQYRNSNKP